VVFVIFCWFGLGFSVYSYDFLELVSIPFATKRLFAFLAMLYSLRSDLFGTFNDLNYNCLLSCFYFQVLS
jgi:hypothetical protein